jgi:hypothetical protein
MRLEVERISTFPVDKNPQMTDGGFLNLLMERKLFQINRICVFEIVLDAG